MDGTMDRGLVEVAPDAAIVPAPDPAAEPDGFVVLVEAGDRIHFLDWAGPTLPDAAAGPGVVLVHGLAGTAWAWTPVARRLRGARHVVAADLRGHGLSDAPTTGYAPDDLAEDVRAVAEGAGILATADDRVVLAGHGFGAIVAAWVAAALGDRCAGLVLVDGGFEDLEAATGEDADAFLRTLDEPPEVLRSMEAYLADRAGWDPGTWDADQERAARAAVVELPVGRVVASTRPHALEASVRAMFAYRPADTLAAVTAPVVELAAAEDEDGTRGPALRALAAELAARGRPPIRVARFPSDGHNLMRYRPVEVTAAILAA
jgi:pimeloyl-ACP methyl ester carboxylesterase